MQNDENKQETFSKWGLLFILSNVLLFCGLCVMYNVIVTLIGLALFIVSGVVLLCRIVNFDVDKGSHFPWWWGGL